ncbi:MAG: DNA alkylation repair protein [Paludibacter sp.]|nr:DNA alkylation repair protein [Paludibacter sp.]
MKFYIANTDLDTQITEIKKTIRLSMNGVVADQMTQRGIIYKKNYGVAIPRIKEIALRYTPNHDLAQRLWALNIRETMIMATLLEPVDKFTPEIAQAWIENFNQIEIIEQINMNLFSKLPFAASLAAELIQAEKTWKQVAGFILIARIANRFNRDEISLIVEIADKLSITPDLHLYKSIGLCLSRLCRKDREIATYILKETENYSVDSAISRQYISNEVKQEILFLNIL